MNVLRPFSILAASLIVVACGGSSSGSFDEGGSASLSITAEENEVPANPQNFAPNPDADYTVQVNVRFTRANGSSVSDGTQVSLSSSNSARGTVSPVSDPDDNGGSATTGTSGGVARFLFTSGPETGGVTLSASGSNPSGSGSVNATFEMTVVESDDDEGRLSVSGSETMPANTQGVGIFLGSPFINELTVRYRGPDGNAGQVADGEVGVAVSPVSRGAFSTLDDPETDDVNEFLQLMGSGPVNMTAGVATVFVHSFDEPGPLTVSVSGQDATSGENFSTEFVIEIEDGAANFLPSQIDFMVSNDPVYIQGSGGATSKAITLNVLDSGNNPVPDPEGHGAEFNNVHLELDAPEGSGARLSGTGADGSVSGTEIDVRTVNGIANFSLDAGSETGSHRIIATVDRADNNVDNDLNDPLTAERTVEVGDGRLASIEVVSPNMEAIRENFATFIDTDLGPETDPETGLLIVPDGTYSLTVTALATDGAGNPVIPGTTINFGKIDAPLASESPQYFVFSGFEGDPEEAGHIFTAADAAEGFLDDSSAPDEAVEPGDTLAMFGKSVPGNREHEAARTIDDVIDDETVTVSQAFNPNDGSGAIVDDGPAIPWVIGRSQVGVVESSGAVNTQGRVSVELTYPTDEIGRPLVLWSQGSRAEESTTKSVAEIEAIAFPGMRPLLLTADPSSVQGNSVAEIRLCLQDALGARVNNARIRGVISAGPASGSLDGEPMPALTELATGSDGPGCVLTELETSDMVPDGDEAEVHFTFGDAEAFVTVVAPESGRLLVQPSRATDPTINIHSVAILLTLLDGSDNPIAGAALTGTCDGGGGTLELETPPGSTDENGEAVATVLMGMSACGDGSGEDFPRTGQCEFTTSSGTPVGYFTAVGNDLSLFGGSPSPCPDEEE